MFSVEGTHCDAASLTLPGLQIRMFQRLPGMFGGWSRGLHRQICQHSTWTWLRTGVDPQFPEFSLRVTSNEQEKFHPRLYTDGKNSHSRRSGGLKLESDGGKGGNLT